MYSTEWKIIDIIVYMALLTMTQLQTSSSTLIPGNFIKSNFADILIRGLICITPVTIRSY